MTDDQELEFNEIVKDGHIRIDLVDRLRSLIESVADRAWDSGKMAGESPHDGSWPNV
jgi:hypothetical protein